MENWQKEYIVSKLPQLMDITSCSPELLTRLRSTILSDGDVQTIESKVTKQEKAVELYNIAYAKADAYDKLISAFESTKQTGALKILCYGKQKEFNLSSSNPEGEDISPKCNPPEEPKYYIKRTLSLRKKLDMTIFDNNLFTADHVFLIEGIPKYELSKIANDRNSKSDDSANQLDKVTVRFIRMDCPDDFDEICKITDKTIHHILFENNSFTWIKSSKNVGAIRWFLTSEAEKFEEEIFQNEFITHNPTQRTFIISDSPGMGKTLLAAKIARQIQQIEQKFVLFFVLNEFAQKLENVNSHTSALQQIASHASTNSNPVLKEDVLEIFSSKHFDLFLDGYDEIAQEKLGLVDVFLSHAKQLQNFRIFVTTRPHLVHNLCTALNVLPYEILPFDKSDQIEFLTKYWVEQYQAKEGENITKFAEVCLKTLQEKMTDKDNEIAGIPLQCWMLAEVYARDARRYSKVRFGSEFKPKVNGIFDMYKALVTLKFERLEKCYPHKKGVKICYKHFHYYESIKLLFPGWIGKLERHLQRREDVKEDVIHSIGILEKRGESEGSRFIHRTFAEYFLAEFLVKHVNTCCDCMDLLFGVILGSSSIQKRQDPYTLNPYETIGPDFYKFGYPNIAYFIDHHLKNYLQNHSIDHRLICFYANSSKWDMEKTCVIPAACCSNNLEYCLDLSSNVIFELQEINTMNHSHFNHLPHLAVIHSKNKSLTEKVVKLKRYEIIRNNPNFDYFNPPRDEKESEQKLMDYPWLPNCTPLHLSVYQGNYDVTEVLLGEYEDMITELKYIMHVCIRDTADETNEIVDEKVEVIKLLHKFNKNWLEEVFEDTACPPLLERNVHVKLIQTLVGLGADINTFSEEFGSVLNCSGGIELLQWISSNGFTLINKSIKFETGYFISTPLLQTIKNSCYSQVSLELLDAFKQAGADFNAKDEFGYSVLFHAVQFSDMDVIAQVLKYGANVNHINKHGSNVTTSVASRAQYQNRKAEIPNLIKLLVSYGFNHINSISRLLPVFWNREVENIEELVEFLHDNHADFNVEYGMGESLLYTAITNRMCSPRIIETLIKFGADVNLEDNKVFEALNRITDEDLGYYQQNSEGTRTLEVIQVILSNRFKQINGRDKYGKTLLFKILPYKNLFVKLLDLFHENGADFNFKIWDNSSILLEAIKESHNEEIIRKIVELGGDLYHRNESNQNAVHIAVQNVNYSALEYILPRSDSNSVDNLGNTALHYLCPNSYTYLMNEILNQTTSSSERTKNDEKIEVYRKTLCLLLKHGAELNIENQVKEMPLTSWFQYAGPDNIIFWEISDFISVTPDIASNVLTLIFSYSPAKISRYLIHPAPFVKFFNTMVCNGGKILIGNRHKFKWNFFVFKNFWAQLALISITPKFLKELQNHIKFKIPKEFDARDLRLLILCFIAIPIEVVFNTFLILHDYNSFLKLHQILFPLLFAVKYCGSSDVIMKFHTLCTSYGI